MTYSNEKQAAVVPVKRAEEDRVARCLAVWLNTFPELPVPTVDFERLEPGRTGMCLSLIQGKTYIQKRYIYGGHLAECHFGVIYRIVPGESPDLRLKAVEVLDRLGDWAYQNKPELGTGVRSIRCEPTTRGAAGCICENGDEDFQILMKLTYEVM